MISNAAIYCTQVARNSVVVHCAELWITYEGRRIEWWYSAELVSCRKQAAAAEISSRARHGLAARAQQSQMPFIGCRQRVARGGADRSGVPSRLISSRLRGWAELNIEYARAEGSLGQKPRPSLWQWCLASFLVDRLAFSFDPPSFACNPKFSAVEPQRYSAPPAYNRSRHSKSSNCASSDFGGVRSSAVYRLSQNGSLAEAQIVAAFHRGSSQAGYVDGADLNVEYAGAEDP
jgi:hypothetical protein